MRQIKPLEVGKQIESLSDDVFGSVYGWRVKSLFDKKTPNILELIFDKLNPDRYCFKIEKISKNDIRISGYTSDEGLIAMGAKKSFILFSIPHQEFKNYTSFPLRSNDLVFEQRDIPGEDSNGISVMISILEISYRKEEAVNFQKAADAKNIVRGKRLWDKFSVITNNQTIAIVISTIILALISIVFYHFFGINLTEVGRWESQK